MDLITKTLLAYLGLDSFNRRSGRLRPESPCNRMALPTSESVTLR